MKPVVLLATLVSFSMAAPAAVPHRDLARRDQCPTLDIAPTGQLPAGTLSPTFLLPISQKEPDTAFPAGQSAIITPGDKCTLTKFDIPASAQNKTCSLVLLLPCGCGSNAQETGSGNITFQGNTGVRFPIPGTTTWNNQPPLSAPFPDAPIIQLGNAYRLGGGPCDYTPGQAYTSVGGSVCSTDTELSFTESNGGNGNCPVGFHIIIS